MRQLNFRRVSSGKLARCAPSDVDLFSRFSNASGTGVSFDHCIIAQVRNGCHSLWSLGCYCSWFDESTGGSESASRGKHFRQSVLIAEVRTSRHYADLPIYRGLFTTEQRVNSVSLSFTEELVTEFASFEGVCEPEKATRWPQKRNKGVLPRCCRGGAGPLRVSVDLRGDRRADNLPSLWCR